MKEPEWRPAASWLWLPIALLGTGYVVFVLVAWCVSGVRSLDNGDPLVPCLVALAATPFVAFALFHGALLRGWVHIPGRLLVATALTAPIALAAFVLTTFVILILGGAMF